MVYYTPVNLNQEDINIVNNTPTKEDYTFIYFCLIIIFVFCPCILYISKLQSDRLNDPNFNDFNIPVVTEPQQPYEVNIYVKECLIRLSQLKDYISSYYPNKFIISSQRDIDNNWILKHQSFILVAKVI